MDVSRNLATYDEQNTLSSVYKMESESATMESAKNHIDSDLGFVFGWNRFNLSLIGLWPDHHFAKRNEANFLMRYRPPILALWIMSFLTAPQALALIAYNFVLSEIIEIIISLSAFIALIVRIMVLWSNGEAWCLLCLTEDWTRKITSREREFMMKNAILGRRISIGFCILVQCLMWMFIIVKSVPLFHLNFDVENTTEFGKQLFTPCYFPFDLNILSNLAFVWIAQFVGVIVSTAAYSSTDCFIAVLIIHLCGQIAILRHNLVNLVEHDTFKNSQVFRNNFMTVVKRHNELCTLAAVIKNAVNFMLLILIFTYTLHIGLQLFSLLIAMTERKKGYFPFLDVLFFFSYFTVTVIHLFLYCYVGEMLIHESESLGLASYSCKWYNLSSKNAKALILVMYRAKAPFQIWAGKFAPISLELFGKVLKTSMGYFSMLLTITEQSAL